jgi:hypothetical protein
LGKSEKNRDQRLSNFGVYIVFSNWFQKENPFNRGMSVL